MNSIDYLSLDIFTLPSVTVENYHLLPSLSGIYFLRSSNQIWYIGLSKNIHTRWYSHHTLDKIDTSKEQFYISWLPYQGELQSLEREFIVKYRPYLNIVDNPDVDKLFVSRTSKKSMNVTKDGWSIHNKVRIRKSVAKDLENIASELNKPVVELLHVILESWVIDYKREIIKDKLSRRKNNENFN